MNPQELPPDVRTLLLDDIDSYEDLESLLLLARTPERRWSVEETAERLRIGNDLAAAALERLDARGLVERQGARFGPIAAPRRAAVAALAKCYEERRLDVMRQMSANAIERLRNSALKGFADAFLLGRRKPDA